MPINADTLARIKNNDPSLVTLDLSGQKLKDEDILKLVDALKTNTHLIDLNLKKNEIGDRGAKALAENKTLKRLAIYNGNHKTITREGFKAFLNNTTLIEFPIQSGNNGIIADIRNKMKENAERALSVSTTSYVTEFKVTKKIESKADVKSRPPSKSQLAFFQSAQGKTREIIQLRELKKEEGVASLIGEVLSPFKTYLSLTHFQPTSLIGTEVYYRSEDHPLNRSYPKQERRYLETKGYGERAHLGDYISPMQLVTKEKFVPMRAIKTTQGDAIMYDALLKYQLKMCEEVAREAKGTSYLQVGVYNQFPCVMVHLSQEMILCKKASDPTKEAWSDLVISFMTGLTNYLAYYYAIPIELVRRSSFGFLTPSITRAGQSFRISIGMVPMVYAKLLADALKILDQVLGYLVNNPVALDVTVFNKTQEYKNYIGESKYHNAVFQCTNLMELLWVKAEKGPSGKPTVTNIVRTDYAKQKIAVDIFNGLRNAKNSTLETFANIFSNVLLSAIQKIKVKDGHLSFGVEDESYIVYSVSFDSLTKFNVLSDDAAFWNLQQQVIQRLRTLPIDVPLYAEAIGKLEEKYKNKTIDKYYFYLETVQHCLLAYVAQDADKNQQDDGYGSDSDTEGEVADKKISAKKIIAHNGMRAILATVMGVRAVMSNKNPQYHAKVYAKSAYFEVVDGIKALQSLLAKDTTINLGEVKEISAANICIFDLNACVTRGISGENVLDQIRLAQGRILILDATSATTDLCRASLHAVVEKWRSFEAVFFVSSGLKFEQFGADINHYGTVRIFASNKDLLNQYYDAIKKQEIPLAALASHRHRRLMKIWGATPVNALFFKPSVEEKKDQMSLDQRPIELKRT